MADTFGAEVMNGQLTGLAAVLLPAAAQ